MQIWQREVGGSKPVGQEVVAVAKQRGSRFDTVGSRVCSGGSPGGVLRDPACLAPGFPPLLLAMTLIALRRNGGKKQKRKTEKHPSICAEKNLSLHQASFYLRKVEVEHTLRIILSALSRM